MVKKAIKKVIFSAFAISNVVLVACGGQGASNDKPLKSNASMFTKRVTWEANIPGPGESICFDFDTEKEVLFCDGSGWDLKISIPKEGGRPMFFSNSGPSGVGNGGVYVGRGKGLMLWKDLLEWKNGGDGPIVNKSFSAERVYFPDSANGVFSGANVIGSSVFNYKNAVLYPAEKVFLITSNRSRSSTYGTAEEPVYALQVLGYYGGASGKVPGYPKFRWVIRTRDNRNTVREAQVNATNGVWVYFDLNSGLETVEEGGWHIAFNRFRMRLNGGGTLGGAVVVDREMGGNKINNKSSLDDHALKAGHDAVGSLLNSKSIPSSTRWTIDRNYSYLNPGARIVDDGILDFGWYKYRLGQYFSNASPVALDAPQADPSRGVMLRGGEGRSFARFHLKRIDDRFLDKLTRSQVWTFEFDVQTAK